MARYEGCVIAEGLHDPTLINTLNIRKVRITENDHPIDYEGNLGRWHMYWVDCDRAEIHALQDQLKRGWYAHFWDEQNIIVVFRDRQFEVERGDASTWAEAIEHGKAQGIPEEELDFLIE